MEVLTAPEAADYLRISQWLLYEVCKRRQLPHFRIGGRILFNKQDLDKWVQQETERSIQPETVGKANYQKYKMR